MVLNPPDDTTLPDSHGESRVFADLGVETSRRVKAGPAIRRARTRWLVHAAERKRVFRTDGHDDARADGVARLAGGESRGARFAAPACPACVRTGIGQQRRSWGLSRRRLRGSEAAAKPAEEHAAGIGVRPAGLAGRVHEPVVGGGSVQFGDLLLGDGVGEMC